MWRQRIGVPGTRALAHAWQFVPRRGELTDLASWRRGLAFHRRLQREDYTMLGSRYGRALLKLAETVEEDGVPGVIVDVGVYNGGSTILLGTGAPSRHVWVFDSFEGLPPPAPEDGKAAEGLVGYAKGSEDKLRHGFAEFSGNGSAGERLHIVRGWVEETLEKHVDDIEQIALLHVDTDWYESVALTLRTFYPKVAPGGYVAVDDYKSWPGAKQAVDEFRAEHGIDAPLVASHYWRKPS
jgi:O-methyltransferase